MLRLNNSISLLKQVRKIATTSINMSSKLSTNHTSGGEEPVVLSSVKNHARLITLNRVKKLNSLNTEMIELMTPPILEYAKSKENNVIILTSNSQRLCALVVMLLNVPFKSEKEIQDMVLIFDKEYNLNYIISTLPKPYISLMDGITFGRCWIISTCTISSSNRKTKLAMPEMDIGFFPDVGTTFFYLD